MFALLAVLFVALFVLCVRNNGGDLLSQLDTGMKKVLGGEFSEYERALAKWALFQLKMHHLTVTLAQGETGGRVRVVEDENPEFYRRFLDTRRYGNKVKQRAPGRRKQVTAALQRIVDNNPSYHKDWIGWELIEILNELDQHGS